MPREIATIADRANRLPDIDVDEWRANTVYQNYTASASPIVWYWRAVRSFSSEERAKLLQFVTGSARVPLEGFGALQGLSYLIFEAFRYLSHMMSLP